MATSVATLSPTTATLRNAPVAKRRARAVGAVASSHAIGRTNANRTTGNVRVEVE